METKEARLEREAQTAPRTAPESLPLAEAIERISSDLKELAHQEVALAKREIGDTVSVAKEQALTLAIGGAALIGGLLVLLSAAVLALALALPAWLAALIVGVVVAGGGVALVMSGKAKLSRLRLFPDHTLESVARDVNAIKRAAT